MRNKLIKNIRIIALVGLFLFSVKLLSTGLIIPALQDIGVITQQCITGGCYGGYNIFNILFGILAGYWFLKEFKETQKFGIYTSAGSKDFQFGLISILFLLPGILFYFLAIVCVIISFVKPQLFDEFYGKIINY